MGKQTTSSRNNSSLKGKTGTKKDFTYSDALAKKRCTLLPRLQSSAKSRQSSSPPSNSTMTSSQSNNNNNKPVQTSFGNTHTELTNLTSLLKPILESLNTNDSLEQTDN